MRTLIKKIQLLTILSALVTIGLLIIEPSTLGATFVLITSLLLLSQVLLEMYYTRNDNKVYFAKTNSNGVIPTKREEDAGWDLYSCFRDDYMVIPPHETRMIPTGIASAFNSKYVFILKERGSTGTKGIAQRCGVIDSGFRNEWMIPITNTTDKVMFISKLSEDETYSKYFTECIMTASFVYPYNKAIAQALLVPVPSVDVVEKDYEDILKIKSERGTGMLGSSKK